MVYRLLNSSEAGEDGREAQTDANERAWRALKRRLLNF